MMPKHGWQTAVVAHDASEPLPEARVLILDTDSRLDPPAVAYRKVLTATRRLAVAAEGSRPLARSFSKRSRIRS